MKIRLKLYLNRFVELTAVVFILITFSQCSYEPDISTRAVDLGFSTDTIQFDTLFTGKQSITKRLKVYNPTKEAILLNDIRLTNASDDFQLIVNGVSGKSFQKELLLAEDSLLILVEATINQSDLNNPFVIRDQLLFSNQGREQSVVIEAWGQNVHFLNDSIISCNAIWTSEKPYVISNSILVEKGCTLTIEAGTKVYSGKDSFILINGTLKINGLADSLVTFTNDRLDEPFSSAPGQWGGIILLEGSSNNEVRYAEIKNSIVGFNVASYSADGITDLYLSNTKVGNTSSSAILALNSDFSAVNSLFYNTASSTSVHIGGGTASYLHCTIANYFPSPREVPSMYLSDSAVDNSETEIIAPLEVNLINSIIYGRINEELLLYEASSGNLSFGFSNCLFKTEQIGLETNNSLINIDPLFINPFNDDFSLSEGSPAISKALPTNIIVDIKGHARDASADIGAFEYIPEKPSIISN